MTSTLGAGRAGAGRRPRDGGCPRSRSPVTAAANGNRHTWHPAAGILWQPLAAACSVQLRAALVVPVFSL